MPRRLLVADSATTATPGRQGLVLVVFLAMVAAILVVTPPQPAQAACTGNAIACENELPGTPASEWDIEGSGDTTIQGFSTQISVNAGSQIQFKVDTSASAFSIKIYRLGYYQGDGARLVDTIPSSQTTARKQGSCATSAATEIYDCGTWSVSASWNVPPSAVSGVYIARLIRSDTGGDSHVPFIVRNDGNTSKVLFQTSDSTWQAYNPYGGSDFYVGGDNGRSYKVSYNRPFTTRGNDFGRDFLFSNEYPMIRYLEQNGYDVSYVSGLDVGVDASLLTKHKVFMSVGHDEYWSKEQRANVTAARDAGVNLAFFGGNDVYWKTRWEPSQDGTNTANRTLVCFKDTWADSKIDTEPGGPTPTWRDPRFGDLGFGPENSLIGTQYQANSVDLAIKVNAEEGKLRLWRDTSLTSLASGDTATLAAHTIGYESNEDVDNGSRPAGLVRLSTATGPTPEYLTDFGGRSSVVAGTTTHHLTMYRAGSGALVFSAGTIQWAWGLDSNHDGQDVPAADQRMRQATANILADMGASPTTLASGLVMPTKSTDSTAPTSVITQPTANSDIAAGDLVTVKGTASDVGGRVGGVEVSVDGGATFHPAVGTTSFSYTGVLNGTGPSAIQVRAADDSGNIQSPTMLAVNSSCPCSIFGALQPKNPYTNDGSAVTLGTKFTVAADGYITGIRFFKGTGNTGVHVGKLYSSDGSLLATANFANETSSGWQIVNFTSAVPVVKGATYVAAYKAPNGHYSADTYFFSYGDYSSGRMTALGGNAQPNGVFGNGDEFPTRDYKQTNYYVDAVFNSVDTTPLTVTKVNPDPGAASISFSTDLTATFSRSIDPASLSFNLLDSGNQVVAGTTSTTSTSAKFSPLQNLAPSTTYTATVTAASSNGVGMAAPYQWSFTTGKVPNEPGVCPCSIFDDTDQPTSDPYTDGSAVSLGMAFRPDTAGLITGVRFFKAPGSQTPHDVYLYSDSGTELAKATATSEASSGWQEVSFAAPVEILANTTYVAAYRAADGKYYGKSGGLGTAIDRSPLHTPARAGRYTYGTGAPTNTSSANYFVDPVYAYSAASAPQVASTSPGDGATSVPVTGHITVVFDSLIKSNTAKITVRRVSDGQLVAGNAGTETGGSTVSFTPTAPFEPSTKYSVTVTDAQGVGGVPMTTAFVAKFTTSGPDACPCSLMESTTAPVVADSKDTDAVTLGLKFSSSADGYITGLRYYRDAANTGTHTGRLWSQDGSELAALTFQDSGAGWQEAEFSNPVAVTAGTTYVASYYAPNGHYSANVGGFSNTMVNTPLSSVGTGGVYLYGNGFPAQSYLATNYYVDVLYTPKNDGSPKVTDVSPADSTTSVAIGVKPSASFADDITASSLSFAVSTEAGQLVTGAVSYDATSRTATFTPEGSLAPSTKYMATVSASSAAGAAMSSPKTWSFTTAAAEPPVVTTFSPATDATNVSVTAAPQAVFAKAVAADSITWTLKAADGSSAGGTSTYDSVSRTATFTPGAALKGSTVYTVTLSASSDTGTPMTSPTTWSFTTVDTAPASVTATAPADQATGVATTGTVTATFDKAITESTLTMTVKTAAGANVAGTATYGAADKKATFTPSAALAGSTTYTVSVSANSAAGVAMTSAKTWSFTTADTAPPSVTTRTPAANATGVVATTKVTAVFDKAITTSTLTMGLKTTAGTTVAGSTSYDSATRTATFTPTAALTSSTGYTASVQASSAAGVAMSAATTWTFTTEAQTFSLFTTSQAPLAANVSNGTALPYTVGVRFTSSRAGKVTAIRYYAGSTNTGTTVSLWNTSGTRLATASTTGTGTGWRTATFSTPVNITAGTTYVASYYAPVGRFASTSGTFASAYSAGPLTVAASGSRNILGNSFPTGSSTANYWVDVLVSI